MLIKIEKSRKYKENNYIMGKKLSKKSSKESSKKSEKQEIYSQIEELKKKTEELNNKAKDLEDQTKDTEFNKQRNFLINTVRDFLGIEVSDAEVLAVLYTHSPSHLPNQHISGEIGYYLKKEDENMLFERKVKNRYAKHHEIRCEDSDMILINFLGKIKPHVARHEFQQQQQQKFHQHRNEQQMRGEMRGNFTEYVPEKYVPLFC